jgi:tripeptidyl-peptidase-1
MKLNVMGTTIVVASGDNGALSMCGYATSFPATSPSVVTVGATQGPKAIPPSPEIMCSTTNGAIITSGGGFSAFYQQPDWQYDAVSAYFDSVGNTTFLGFVLGKTLIQIDGTSASTPGFAWFVSLVNSYRKTHGMSTLMNTSFVELLKFCLGCYRWWFQ